jgi:Zn-dependent peptidase ImmA (M78 family)/transcriptional regulator with XRE-family HTH domain
MEDQHQWVEVGQRVREARLAAKLSQDELGRRVGLDRTMIAKIEAGSRRVDAVELGRLGSALGLPLGHFLDLRPIVVSRRAELLEDEATEVGCESHRLEAALLAWLRDVRQLINLGVLGTQPLLAFPERVHSTSAARKAARWLRGELGIGDQPIPALTTFCERAGLLVAVTTVPGDGASMVDDDVAVAVVSSSGDPGRRRATAAHELGHLVLGDEYANDLGVSASREEREALIDAFAAEVVLPTEVIVATEGGVARDELVALAATYRVSWSLAVKQAVRAGALEQTELRRWLASTPTKAELMDAVGWVPQPDLAAIRVPPSYAHAVIEARKRGWVTTARAVELMRGQIDAADLPALEDDLRP